MKSFARVLYFSQNVELLTGRLKREGTGLRRKSSQKTTPNQLLSYHQRVKYFLRKGINYIITKYFHDLYFFFRKVLNQLLNYTHGNAYAI